jgi:hypothetical protein
MTDAIERSAEDKGEYDYEGDMAKSQLRSILANAKRLHEMLKPDSNLPEWVQSKITLAEDYILTAANYMEGEMNEEMKPYVKAAQQKFDLEARANRKNTKQAGSAAADYERKKQKEADVALKAIKFAKGKKNKIDMKPQLNGEKDANIQ